MTNYTTTIVLNKTRPSIVDEIFDIAEIEVDVELECSFYGGCEATHIQPEEYPEAHWETCKINSIRIFPIDETKNDILVNFLLTNERKQKIQKLTEEYINTNWNDGKHIEKKVLEQAAEEYQSYIDGWADVDDDK